MLRSNFQSAVLTFILALSATCARADVITFENYAPTNSYKILTPTSPYTQLPGYALSGTGISYVFDSPYYLYNQYIASNGTDYLRVGSGLSATLTSTTSALFSINSIDLANYLSGLAADNATATLTGVFANGTKITESFTLTNNNILTTNDFTTELLIGFTNLTSFTIAASGYFLDVDNIVINQTPAAATSDVPEPASLTILGLGLLGIGAARRRKSA